MIPYYCNKNKITNMSFTTRCNLPSKYSYVQKILISANNLSFSNYGVSLLVYKQLSTSDVSTIIKSLSLLDYSLLLYKHLQKMAIIPSILLTIFPLFLLLSLTKAAIPGVYSGGSWQTAHATFYGGDDASGTMGEPIILKHSYQKPHFINHSLYILFKNRALCFFL